jgi:hypothetical protein
MWFGYKNEAVQNIYVYSFLRLTMQHQKYWVSCIFNRPFNFYFSIVSCKLAPILLLFFVSFLIEIHYHNLCMSISEKLK